MRYPENIEQTASLQGIDWLGFIFYERSPRYIGLQMPTQDMTRSLSRIGVFVNATEEQLIEAYDTYQLDYLQLHGEESPELCHSLQKRGIHLIKAFSIASEQDLERTTAYEGRVDYFLFDTKCEQYGGSGKQFDWSVLQAYTGETSFILSGGINPESIDAIKNFRHPRFKGIDLNSGFEIEPGNKNISQLSDFLSQLNIKH